MPARFLLVVCVLAALGSPAAAWGPHTEITAAGLTVLTEKNAVKKYLGDDFARLSRDYCWMGDWQEAVRPDHYADDYLLFPGSPRHVSHMHPHVRKTYAPFFKRALQAWRTESPRDAARWTGSLLHFVQDAGSPPHTTGIGGGLHSKMERWVDEAKLDIAGYRPRLLGETDAEALREFEDRMAGLHDYSKVRAVQLRPLVEKLELRENQPLELECALEVVRVTADVVHTLWTLGRKESETPGATLEGKLKYMPPTGYATVPAKVAIAGTGYSTTTDANGIYRFRNLPPGRHTIVFLATGMEAERVEAVVLKACETATLAPELKPDAAPGNLVRNPRFRLRWIDPDRPDGWTPDPEQRARWASAPIRVPVGQNCSVRIEFAEGKQSAVSLRWQSNPSSTAGSRLVKLDETRLPATIAPPADLEPFEKGFLFLEVLLHAEKPQDALSHIAVVFTKN